MVPILNPGARPVIPAGATVSEAASIQYAHNAATLAFNTFSNVNRSLLQQLLGAVKNMFLQVLCKPHREYSRSSMLDLPTHLYKTYAVILNANFLANNKCFRELYLPIVSIEIVWRQIDNSVAYADAGLMLYSSKQVADNAYQLMLNTGIFAAGC